MNLPLTEFYLSKGDPLSKTPQMRDTYSGEVHGSFGRPPVGNAANPFTQQLERDSIVAGDKLRSRREANQYVPAYQQTMSSVAFRP